MYVILVLVCIYMCMYVAPELYTLCIYEIYLEIKLLLEQQKQKTKKGHIFNLNRNRFLKLKSHR